MVLLYWSIGNRVRTNVLKEKRAEDGKEIVSAVGRQLAREFGDGFGNYTEDRHQWLGEQSARTLHEQATQLAANGELPRPVGAKLHGSVTDIHPWQHT